MSFPPFLFGYMPRATMAALVFVQLRSFFRRTIDDVIRPFLFEPFLSKA